MFTMAHGNCRTCGGGARRSDRRSGDEAPGEKRALLAATEVRYEVIPSQAYTGRGKRFTSEQAAREYAGRNPGSIVKVI